MEPPSLNIGSAVNKASCHGNDGRAAVLVNGGTKPYQFSWSSGGIHPVEKNLSAGIYSIKVIDANGCKTEESVLVNSVGGPVISLISINGVSCINPISGSIKVSPFGGYSLV